jgi:acyl-CoA dehydrogenase
MYYEFEIPEHLQGLRVRVLDFIETRIYPVEDQLAEEGERGRTALAALMALAKSDGLWALGHPKELGGGGLPFADYVFINEVQGRSEWGQQALGTASLQDSLMLEKYARGEVRERYLSRLVAGEIFPSFAMTEPGVSSSDPANIQTSARLEGEDWIINGRKWFTTYADRAPYTTVMCRTESGAPDGKSFSMIVVPAETEGRRLVRETPVLGIAEGHCELALTEVRVPMSNLIGQRGQGFQIAQDRLGPGRIFHSMRWLGQAQRAFDLLCNRLYTRKAFGEVLAEKQLLQKMVFDSYVEIQAARLLTLQAAKQIDGGKDARVAIGAIKVAGAQMLHNVIDRAIQVHGAEGVTDDTPLSRMYRLARLARIYDGPDEVHISSVSRRILRQYKEGNSWEFATQ